MKDLYLLVDGTHADPDECDVGADNELRHNDNGVPVALNEDGSPQTVKQGAVDNKNVEAAEAGEAAAKEAEQINADNAAAAKAETKEAGDAVVTEINPATGKSSDEDLLLTTDDLKPEKEPKKAKKAPKPKNRELRTR